MIDRILSACYNQISKRWKKVVPPSMRREVIVMSLSEALLLFQLIAMIVFGILGYMKK